MHVLAAIAGCALLIFALADAFDTIVLARRAERIFGVTAFFYAVTWKTFMFFGRRIHRRSLRERFLSVYGPLSLLLLLAIWAMSIIVSFTLLQWAAGLQTKNAPMGFAYDLYFCGAALFTVSVGQPEGPVSKFLFVIEAGLGFSLLALVIGYLPVLYQSFADREQHISMLDARAGSPPAATELIVRQGRHPQKLEQQLADWEEWASGVLESHLSYPMLAYFRSQHENQSWLSAMVTILDASALAQLCTDGDLQHQAQLTFAMCRHTLADMVSVFRLSRPAEQTDRLPREELQHVRDAISESALNAERLSEKELAELRRLYEPFAASLSQRFLMALPGWLPIQTQRDNWLRSSWDRHAAPYSVSDPFEKG
jgi:hypothetical protein